MGLDKVTTKIITTVKTNIIRRTIERRNLLIDEVLKYYEINEVIFTIEDFYSLYR